MTEYSQRLGCTPEIIVRNEYALWRSDALNLSVRVDHTSSPGTLRHLGWEDPEAAAFRQDTDTNGILWEVFNAAQQASEIQQQWPEAEDYLANDIRDE